MPETVTIEEAQAHLAKLIARMIPGEEMIITQNEQPVAKLIVQRAGARRPRQPGSARGRLVIHE